MKKAVVAANIMELFREEREKKAATGIDALLKLYHTKKDSFTREEVIDLCEKYFVGYWDVEVSTKKYKASTKKADNTDAK